jgi:hypothetical protein
MVLGCGDPTQAAFYCRIVPVAVKRRKIVSTSYCKRGSKTRDKSKTNLTVIEGYEVRQFPIELLSRHTHGWLFLHECSESSVAEDVL